jgi:hypothetical protein
MSDSIKLSSVTLDCPNAGDLAAFYADITGGKVTFLHEAWATVNSPGERIDSTFGPCGTALVDALLAMMLPVGGSTGKPDGDLDGAVPDPEVVAEAWNVWRSEVAFTDRFVAEAPDLDVVGNDPWRGAVSLREVLVHMVEEYARHNGHAGLLRERIDARVGQ